jgi:hypothetical protein
MSEPELSPEERARRAEQALEEALAERNRLWEQLQRRESVERDLEYWRGRAEGIEQSRWWRLGLPLRWVKRFRADPAGMLQGRVNAIRKSRRSRG